jgi:Fe2+ or Zn2+ uptake regulation protein
MRVTESEIIQYLQRAGDQYAPLTINRLEEQVLLTVGHRADAIIDFSIQGGPSFEALVEIVSVPTPKNILEKSRLLSDYISKINKSNTITLIIAPYIGKKQAKMLADTGISWMDISGNMLIRVSNQIYIERTGKRNRFPDTAPIKKIFQGTSSLVSRALLLKPEGFSSLYEVVNFINERNANITMSTVSKVLKSLEEELLINRNKSLISVPDREKLLDRLTESYINYIKRKERKTYRFSVQQPRYASLKRNVQKSNYLACGFYATQIKGLGVTNEIMICVKNMDQAKKDFDFLEPDAEFGNVKLIENNDVEIWFNSVDIELTIASIIKVTIPIIDDIELYLEMMADTPRGPKIAEQIKQRILNKADISG